MNISISRKSWHYRMTEWCWGIFGKNPSNSLCGYFWQMVFSPIVAVVAFVAIVAAVLLLLFWGFYLSGALACDFLNWIHVLPSSFDVVPGVFNWRHLVASLLINGSLIGYMVYNHFKETTGAEDGVILSFIKAKKRKICPLIEYKD